MHLDNLKLLYDCHWLYFRIVCLFLLQTVQGRNLKYKNAIKRVANEDYLGDDDVPIRRYLVAYYVFLICLMKL